MFSRKGATGAYIRAPMERRQPDTTGGKLLGYGSLLNLRSLQRTLPRLQREDLRPVRVDGLARVFHLVSLSRQDHAGPVRAGLRGAVLDVRPCPGAQLGAVLFDVRDGEEMEALNRREFCYDRLEGVAWRDFHAGGDHGEASTYSVASAAELRERLPDLWQRRIEPLQADGLLSDRVRPVDDYLHLCLEGAFSWGRAFGHDFLRTTWLADGRPLCAWGPAVEAVRALGHEVPPPPYPPDPRR